VQSVYGKLGVHVPRTSQQQAGLAQTVSTPRIGDLVFASFSAPNDHVGIYIGNGKVVSALDEAKGVAVSLVTNWPGVHYGRVV
jgi:cell wall-associated NlpC family hydrolase